MREERFDDHSHEFPRIDERHDLAAGSTVVRNLGAGRGARVLR